MSVLDADGETIDQQQAFIEENIASSDATKISSALMKLVNLVVQGDKDITVYSELFAKVRRLASQLAPASQAL